MSATFFILRRKLAAMKAEQALKEKEVEAERIRREQDAAAQGTEAEPETQPEEPAEELEEVFQDDIPEDEPAPKSPAPSKKRGRK